MSWRIEQRDSDGFKFTFRWWRDEAKGYSFCYSLVPYTAVPTAPATPCPPHWAEWIKFIPNFMIFFGSFSEFYILFFLRTVHWEHINLYFFISIWIWVHIYVNLFIIYTLSRNTHISISIPFHSCHHILCLNHKIYAMKYIRSSNLTTDNIYAALHSTALPCSLANVCLHNIW